MITKVVLPQEVVFSLLKHLSFHRNVYERVYSGSFFLRGILSVWDPMKKYNFKTFSTYSKAVKQNSGQNNPVKRGENTFNSLFNSSSKTTRTRLNSLHW